MVKCGCDEFRFLFFGGFEAMAMMMVMMMMMKRIALCLLCEPTTEQDEGERSPPKAFIYLFISFFLPKTRVKPSFQMVFVGC